MRFWSDIRIRSLSLTAAAGLFGLAVWSACSSSVDKPAEILALEDKLPENVDYNLHIKPILSDRCFACHGPDQAKQKAGLRLDTPESAYKALKESGHTAIVPGKPGKSELYHRIVSSDPDYMMPTPESNLSLTTEEKALLIRWIEQGAEYKPHWSLVAPQKPDLPAVRQERWVRNDIDRFVLKKLEEKGLQPAPEADKTTLLRRLSLDLTGLPPTVAEVDAFLADKSPNAYEKAVDRLLASPHYGERQAAEWLDIARYADTHGYQDDGLRTMWPYRDWVIRAFNQNLSFDQFTTWQLAGDMLPKPSKPEVARDMLIATAFNRNHQQSQEGGIVPEEYQSEYIADRVNTFGKAMLGLTVECARCHDHKYDPISAKDYYSLSAFFAQNNEYGQIPYNGEPSPHITLTTPEAEAKLKPIRAQIAALDQARNADLKSAAGQRFRAWLATASQTPGKALIPADQDLMIHIPFDQFKDVVADKPKKDEGKDKKKPAQPVAAKPEEKKPPRIRRLFVNVANDTLPMETQGDLDFPIPHVPGPRGKGVRLIGESLLQLKSGDNWGKSGNKPAWFERNQPFTVSIWVNVLEKQFEGPLFNRNLGPFNGFRGYQCVRLKDGRLSFQLSYVWPDDAIDIETLDPLRPGRWTQLTMAYDGSSKAGGLKVYVDGRPARIRVVTDNLTQSTVWGKKKTSWGAGTPNFAIGHRHDYNFKGYAVDELRVYRRKLTSLEVQGLFTNQDALQTALRTTRRSPAQESALFDYFLTNVDPASQERRLQREQLLGQATEILNEQIDVMVMRERRYTRPTYILKRGAYDAPAEKVTADTPDQLFKIPADYPKNRLGLAKWLIHAENPLFSRVVVNRYWQQLFGQGLVKSSDDFGNQGNLPTHPELLDWLAIRFREGADKVAPWDVKALQKMLVLSATYRQSSVTDVKKREADADNSLLSRGPSYRLSAEQIRDNALAASGLLTRKIGGPSVHPYQPAGIWEALATRNAVNYVQNHGDSLYRRSMYTIWKRSSPPPMMLNFDASERHFCIVRRQKTSTPLQALVTLNDPQFVEAARVLAQKALAQASLPGAGASAIPTPKDGLTALSNQAAGPARAPLLIDYFFKATVSRPARPQERALMQQLYAEEAADFGKNPKRAAELLRVGEYPVDKRISAPELAAWTVVASAIMNFDEAIIKR